MHDANSLGGSTTSSGANPELEATSTEAVFRGSLS
jgi:hypothetical protein